jgi:hypothetical protein
VYLKCIHTSAAAAAAVYGTVRKISHLLYTDDLRMIGKSEEELRNEIRIVKTSSNDIEMEFALEKCARVSSESGKIHRK